MSEPVEVDTSVRNLIHACCAALDDKKAEHIRVLYLGSKSTVADYFVIATGTSHPHLRALRNTLHGTLSDHGIHTAGRERDTASGWLVVDAQDCVFHLFTAPMRSFYQLERLWSDAEDVTSDFLPG